MFYLPIDLQKVYPNFFPRMFSGNTAYLLLVFFGGGGGLAGGTGTITYTYNPVHKYSYCLYFRNGWTLKALKPGHKFKS